MPLSPTLPAQGCWPQRHCTHPPRPAAAGSLASPGRPICSVSFSRRGHPLICAQQRRQPGSKAGRDWSGPPPTAGGGSRERMEPPRRPHPAAHGLHLPPGRRLEGQGLLLLVALMWGSYTPAVRLVYTLPDPPSPVVVAAARGVLQLLLLLLPCLVWGAATWRARAVAMPADEAPEPTAPCARRQSLLAAGESSSDHETCMPLAAVVVVEQVPNRGRSLLCGLPPALLASLEIGFYNTTGTLAQSAGLDLTSATRAAFLVQSSTLFTPLLAALAGMAPSRRVWIGSVLALAGAVLVTLDRGPTVASQAAEAAEACTSTALGDALTVLAALCYSAATVRLPVWAVRHRVQPVKLALGKSAVLAAVSSAALGFEAARLAAAGEGLWYGWHQPQGWAILGWTAVGPGALGAVLHVKGQSLVSPTDAQLVFCSVPLWSALIAAVVLPDEAVGPATWLGGGVIAASGLVAAMPSKQRS